MTNTPYHQTVASQIIESLKQGTAPWLKPWAPGVGQMPFNPVTGKRYRGINALYLMLNQGSDNRWLTYKQAQSMDAQVRKGEKGTSIQYWKFTEEKIKKDALGKPVLNQEGQPVKVQVNLERPQVFYARVFHASQIDNMPELIEKTQDWSQIERAEQLLLNSGAAIFHSEADRAFYRPSSDSIHLPPKAQFKSAAHYYATALHELGHWSGHSSRLNRDLSHPFGSEGYAKEELRAEIASMLLGSELGIGHDPSQHTAYIKSWIRILEDDPLEIFRASADAEKIVNHLQALEQVQDLEQEQTLKPKETLMESENINAQKIWLDIPYHQKETLKALAGTLENGEAAIAWDKKEKKWFAREGANLEALAPWLPKEPTPEEEKRLLESKIWLSIPFKQKETAKSVIGKLPNGTSGIGWDKEQKCWYAKAGVALEKIQAWLPENQTNTQDKALLPRDEFKQALISLGAIVTGEHPVMDSKTHRIAMEGDKQGEKAGFYIAHLDGIPAGYLKNNRTGEELTWKSKGYVLSDTQKTSLKAQALEHQKTRELALKQKQKSTALKLQQKLSEMREVTDATPYMTSKGIEVHAGIYTDDENKLTCIPATDIEGHIWTVQYIAEDGSKRFAKDARKEGCFHVLGGMEKLITAPVIVIAEGYATAATIKEATGLPAVVCAFDAGNLKSVAMDLHDKYKQTPILLAGDDDKHLEITKNINPGRTSAEHAASAVEGHVIIPTFAPCEQSVNPKKFSDFNDLANHSKLGFEGVKRQLKSRIDKIVNQSNRVRLSRKGHSVHPANGY